MIKVYGAEVPVESSQQAYGKEGKNKYNGRTSNKINTDNNILIGKSQKEIDKILNANKFVGGNKNPKVNSAIENPVSYLKKNVGKKTDVYSLKSSKILPGIGNTKCNSLGGNNNCTLTAFYNILKYYRTQGYNKIPKDNNKMYDIVKKCAIDVGYTKKRGLPVNKNNNLVKRTWQKGFGYSSGTGNSNYMWTYSTLKKQIDSGNPCMFSIANGYYYNHTVAVVGYKEYKNMRTGKVYTFLVVHDGWSTTTRYIAMKNTGASYVACQTSIKVPSKKK